MSERVCVRTALPTVYNGAGALQTTGGDRVHYAAENFSYARVTFVAFYRHRFRSRPETPLCRNHMFRPNSKTRRPRKKAF